MGIQTVILSQNPPIVIHTISAKLDEVEAKIGAIAAIETISSLIVSGVKVDLILNMKDYIFDSIDSHRIWSLGFKAHRVVKECVGNVAVVGKHSDQLDSEKELMETDALRFFADCASANNWLLNIKN